MFFESNVIEAAQIDFNTVQVKAPISTQKTTILYRSLVAVFHSCLYQLEQASVTHWHIRRLGGLVNSTGNVVHVNQDRKLDNLSSRRKKKKEIVDIND